MTGPDRPARVVRPERAPRPDRLSIARALLGAAISVAGVLLGIGSLLLLSDPSSGPGPTVSEASTTLQDVPEPAASVTPPPFPSAAPLPSALPSPSSSVVPSVVPSAASTAAVPPSPVAARADPLVVPVTVLNNSRIDGLADRAAARFRRGGWPVRETGNFRGRIPVTTVYYDPGVRGQQASAQAFARRFAGIARVRPRFDTLPARGVVVVVTRDDNS